MTSFTRLPILPKHDRCLYTCLLSNTGPATGTKSGCQLLWWCLEQRQAGRGWHRPWPLMSNPSTATAINKWLLDAMMLPGARAGEKEGDRGWHTPCRRAPRGLRPSRCPAAA